MVTLCTNEQGQLFPQHQVQDYMLRGDEFEELNFLDFIVETYETRMEGEGRSEEVMDERVMQGRYWPSHPKACTHRHILRREFHNSLPNIVGPWFPRRDDPSPEYYYASMLALLRPWRCLEILKTPTRGWEEEFSAFVEGGSQRVVDVLAGIQYYYDSKEKAMTRNTDIDIEEENQGEPDDEGDMGDIDDDDGETVCFVVLKRYFVDVDG